jgi:hypothetical protein
MLSEQPHPQERSMMTAQDRAAGVERLRRLPDLLEAAVRGLSDPQLDTPYRVGGWTVRQVVHHLADSHMNAFVRCKLILTEEHPTLKPYDQDRWPSSWTPSGFRSLRRWPSFGDCTSAGAGSWIPSPMRTGCAQGSIPNGAK